MLDVYKYNLKTHFASSRRKRMKIDKLRLNMISFFLLILVLCHNLFLLRTPPLLSIILQNPFIDESEFYELLLEKKKWGR